MELAESLLLGRMDAVEIETIVPVVFVIVKILDMSAKWGWVAFIVIFSMFAGVFYLRYHLYRLYFPVMCLGRYRRLLRAEQS